MILPGIYFIKDSIGFIPIITFISQEVKLKNGKLLTRARIVPMHTESIPTKPPREFEIKRMTISEDNIALTLETNL